MSELITKLNPALVAEAMQTPAIIYESDYIEQLNNIPYKSHTYDPNTKTGIVILNDSTIPDQMFQGSKVSSIQLINITEIGLSAFYWCKSLTSVTIPGSVTRIRGYAFRDCSSLTSITIPDSVTEIGSAAFHMCLSLTSVTISDRVTKIGQATFFGCTSLKEVYCKSAIVPEGDVNMFNYGTGNTNIYIPLACKICVPIASVEAYKSAQYWSDYADQIVGVVFEDEVLESGKNVKTIGGQSILGEGDISFVQPITYVELRDLVEMGKLTPGKFYRITDYITTTTQEKTLASGHQFDLIVQAVDSKTLSPDAKAIKHPGTTYFDRWDLSKWEIKYDIRNNQQLYKWAESDPVHLVTSKAGQISAGCMSLPYAQTVEVNGETKYLYKPSNLSAYLNSGDDYDRQFCKMDSGVALEEVQIVTQTIDINEDNYFDVEFLAITPDGTIVRSWLVDEYYDSNNLGFWGDYYFLDMYYTGNTVVINDETYYTWYCYDDNVLRQELEQGNVVHYTGSLDSLYYAFNEPLEISDQTYTKTVNEVYDINTDEIYNLLYSYDNGSEEEDLSAELDNVTYTPPTSLNGKGVIYYMKDNLENEAPFDFHNILIGTNSSDASHIFNLDDDDPVDDGNLLALGNVITTDTSTIPLIVFQRESVKNKVHVKSETTIKVTFTRSCLQNTITIALPLDDSRPDISNSSTYNNCTITIKGTGYIGSNYHTFNNCVLGWGSGSISLGYQNAVLYNSQLETDSGSGTIQLPAGNAYNLHVKLPDGISSGSMNITSDVLTDSSNHYAVFYSGGSLHLTHDLRNMFVEKFSGDIIILKEGIYYLQTAPTTSLTIKTRYTSNNGCEYFCEFTTASSGTTIALPAWVYWKNGIIPTFEPSTSYFLHIVGDKASCTPCYADPAALQLQYTSSTNSSLSGINSIVSSNSLVSNEYDGVGIATFSKPIKTINLSYSSAEKYVTTLALPDSVETISTSFHSYYKSLTDITLGNNVKSCSTLNNNGVTDLKVHIPNLAAWLPIEFGSPSLHSGHRLYINGVAVEGELTIPASVTKVGSYNLAGYTGLTKINLPSHVTDVGSDALSGFDGILTIASQTLLNKYPRFYWNNAWDGIKPTEIVFKSPITNIPKYCLDNKSTIINVTLPSTLKTLESNALPKSLVTLTIPALSSSNIDAPGLNGWSKDNWKSISLQSPSDWFKFNLHTSMWNYNSEFPILKNSDGTTITQLTCYTNRIYDYALARNKHITSVTAQYVEEIGKCAFEYSALQSIQLSMGLHTIKERAFYDSSLQNINLPYGLTHIGREAFSDTYLSSVTIPSTVTDIELQAFYSTNRTLTVYCEALVPPTLGSRVFYSGSYLKAIYVPTQSVEVYKTAPQWSEYASKISGYNAVQRFTFEIDSNPYLCEEGMTWRDWATSQYANDAFTVEDDSVYYDGISISYDICGEYDDGEETWADCWSESVNPDSIIDKEKSYYLY